jgi:hypothetical protein
VTAAKGKHLIAKKETEEASIAATERAKAREQEAEKTLQQQAQVLG